MQPGFYIGGATESRVHFFLKKVDDLLFSRRPQNLSSPSSGVHIFGIFHAHRTLLVERTVLLY